MKGAPSRHVAPAQKDGTERRTVPGPRSKSIFDRIRLKHQCQPHTNRHIGRSDYMNAGGE